MWQNDPRFSYENFGNQPTYIILQALEHGYKLRSEDKHLNELGIATLTSCFVNANRDPKKSSPAKPTDFFFFNVETTKWDVHPEAVESFFALAKRKKLPTYAMNVIDIYKLKELRTHVEPENLDVWLNENCVLIQPIVFSDKIKVRLALIGKPDILGKELVFTDVNDIPKCSLKIPEYIDGWSAISDLVLLSEVTWLTPQLESQLN